jgi:putative flavoprotein involved in K+ transport
MASESADMEKTHTLIVGGGQAGLAISAHLRDLDIAHIIVERGAIAERWRSARWDSLVMNGPAWHDRFPRLAFDGWSADSFPGKEAVADYFERFAATINAPIRCGVDVKRVVAAADGGYLVDTSQGPIHAKNIVAATGPFQMPTTPAIVPEGVITQIHSHDYKNPMQLEDGAVLVVGSGSSGAQIADELLQAGRQVYLSIGPHERPPRSYRGKDFCWWLGTLGKWQMKTPPAGREHVTIAVSGANGGKTVDFRRFAQRGMTLLGLTQSYENGRLFFADDLQANIRDGDKTYLGLLAEADDYITANQLDFPAEEDAKRIQQDPDCLKKPIRQMDIDKADLRTIIWATGYKQDFGWLAVDCFDKQGRPDHVRGISRADGVYFLGLPWLSMRGSSFIWGVWEDAGKIANHIASQ